MDTAIHFSELIGLTIVLAGTGAWIWAMWDLHQRRQIPRRKAQA